MSAYLNRDMFAALAEELAIVVGAMIDRAATAAPGAPATGRQWIAEVRAEGALTGTINVVLDHEGTTAITRLMTGVEGAVPDEMLLDSLREVFAQTVSAVALKPVARGAQLSVGQIVAAENRVPEGEWVAYAITAENLSGLLVTTYGALVAAPSAGSKAAAAPPPAPAETGTAAPAAKPLDDRIDVILDIDLPLVVRFGRTELPLRALTRLGPGSVIDLGRSPDDPVEVLVSNRVVAHGEVVIVSGNYGIRILDVVSQRERMRSVEV